MTAPPSLCDASHVTCQRCGQVLTLAPGRDGRSWPFRRAAAPLGLCASCVVTTFLYNTYPINQILDEDGPARLLAPDLREAFRPILANCEMDIDEIDWPRVVAHWSLPVVCQRSAENPYHMGEAATRPARRRALRAQKGGRR